MNKNRMLLYYYCFAAFKDLFKDHTDAQDAELETEAKRVSEMLTDSASNVDAICDQLRDEQTERIHNNPEDLPELTDYYIGYLRVLDFARLYYENENKHATELAAYKEAINQYMKLPRRTNSMC